jgi:hypothetical protein
MHVLARRLRGVAHWEDYLGQPDTMKYCRGPGDPGYRDEGRAT